MKKIRGWKWTIWKVSPCHFPSLAAAERWSFFILVHVSMHHMKQIYCINVRAQWIRLPWMAAINSHSIYLCLIWDQCGETFDEQPLPSHLRHMLFLAACLLWKTLYHWNELLHWPNSTYLVHFSWRFVHCTGHSLAFSNLKLISCF